MSYLIDRQAVIDLLKQMRKDGDMVPWEGKDVFARIRKLPTIQPEKAQLSQEGTTKDTTSDLISRTETVERLRGVIDVTVPITDYDGGYVDGVEVGISTVSTMPTIQPERAKGEWSDGYRWQRCSLCKQTGRKSWNYCPNCGADMRGKQNEL